MFALTARSELLPSICNTNLMHGAPALAGLDVVAYIYLPPTVQCAWELCAGRRHGCRCALPMIDQGVLCVAHTGCYFFGRPLARSCLTLAALVWQPAYPPHPLLPAGCGWSDQHTPHGDLTPWTRRRPVRTHKMRTQLPGPNTLRRASSCATMGPM